MALLPICYQTPRTVLGHAVIDDDLANLLLQRTWYCSNIKRAASPRFSVNLRTESGEYKLSHFFLNRVVMAAQLCERPDFERLWASPAALWNFIAEIPRVKMENGDPYDCRSHNISTAVRDDTIYRRDRRGISQDLPTIQRAFGQAETLPEPIAHSSDGIRLTEDYSALVIPAGTASRDAQKFLDMLGGASPSDQTPVATPADPEASPEPPAEPEPDLSQQESVFEEGPGQPEEVD